MQLFLNNWETALAQPLAATAESLEIPAAAAAELGVIGGGDYYVMTLAGVDNQGNEVAWEIVRATGVSGGVIAITRAQEGTLALDWPSGTGVSLRFTLGAANALGEHEAAEDPHPQYTTQAEAEAAAAAAVSGHTADPNAHPQYVDAAALAAASLATGDVLVTLREPATGYAPAGTIQPQAAYPALFELIGLLEGTPPSTANWGRKVIDTVDQDHWWMGTDTWNAFVLSAGPGRLLASWDRGSTWETVPVPGAGTFYALETDTNSNWLATEQASGFLWRSTDEAETWAKITTPAVAAVALTMAPNGTCIAAGVSGKAMRSTDSGATWALVTSGFGTTTIYEVATDGAGHWVMAGNGGKVSYSTNDGATWTLVPGTPFGSTNMRHIATDGAGKWIVASAESAKVGISTDNGATWTVMTSGIDSFSTVAHVDGGEWIAFGNDTGYPWRTLDGGATWSAGNVGNGQIRRVVKVHDGTIFACPNYGNYILEPAGSYPYNPNIEFKVPAFPVPEGFRAYVKA